MIDGTGEVRHRGSHGDSRRARSGVREILVGPAVRSVTAALLICGLTCGLPARVRGETITRRHLDAARVEFSGLDLNGDKIPDAIIEDNLRKTITCFYADERRSLKLVDPLTLPEEERRLIPDALVEQDLDGDEVRDLLLYNREYLRKYADNEAVFVRLLANAVYIGQVKDAYQDLGSCSLTPEARKAIVEKARGIELRNRL